MRRTILFLESKGQWFIFFLTSRPSFPTINKIFSWQNGVSCSLIRKEACVFIHLTYLNVKVSLCIYLCQTACSHVIVFTHSGTFGVVTKCGKNSRLSLHEYTQMCTHTLTHVSNRCVAIWWGSWIFIYSCCLHIFPLKMCTTADTQQVTHAD